MNVAHLIELLQGRRIVALTGAGCSTESGIPDYRGPETRRRARNPIQYREFMQSASTRRRYWARSALGWPRVRDARPNATHHALSALEDGGLLAGVITQNVDGLHGEAGSRRVVELHGALRAVRCVECDAVISREFLQSQLLARNPGWQKHAPRGIAPDGDADLAERLYESFEVIPCGACGSALKPDVVFFGENVRREVYAAARALFDEAEVLLVLGSSLAVFSGYRFVMQAAQRDVPVAIVNLGPVARGGELAQVQLDARLGEVMPSLAEWLLWEEHGNSAP